jgi:hypothetical protein
MLLLRQSNNFNELLDVTMSKKKLQHANCIWFFNEESHIIEKEKAATKDIILTYFYLLKISIIYREGK